MEMRYENFPLLLSLETSKAMAKQGCALAEPGDPWRLTFALGRLENLRFFIQIICLRWPEPIYVPVGGVF